MDNTQNNGMNPQPASDSMQPGVMQDPSGVAPVVPAMDPTMQPAPSMGDLAGMTPPPAQMQDMSAPAPIAMPEPAPVPPMMDTSAMTPSVPTSPMGDMNTSMDMSQQQQPAMDTNNLSLNAMPAPAPVANGEADDYAYAEDLLDEILDSLDRIEAKLEAIEKKVGQ